jgi:alkylhydroperoxidase family enzyme
LDAEAMDAARNGKSKDAKIQAVLTFAQTLVRKRGHVSDADVSAVRAAGVTEGEVGEIVGHVALNTLTNYFNNTAGTVIDFPVVEVREPAAV